MPSRAVNRSNPCWNDTPRKTKEHSFCNFAFGHAATRNGLLLSRRYRGLCSLHSPPARLYS